MKIINFVAGPGAGKSTLAHTLFAHMKKKGYNVEFVHEYAKDLTWEERFNCLSDQLYVAAKQNRKLARLKGKVDWVVTDTSLILGLMYMPDDYLDGFKPLLIELFNSYNNLNVFVERTGIYVDIGRNQSYQEAVEIDNRVKNLFKELGLPFVTVPNTINAYQLVETLNTFDGCVFNKEEENA
jgi:tRNA uridine 5-carbamoylmethylation protein Kti12